MKFHEGEQPGHGSDEPKRFTEDELEQRVQARTRELVERNRKLEQQLAEQTEAEQALRDSEAAYRQLVSDVTDMISRHTPDGRYTYVSPSSRTLLGYEPDELLGKSAFEGIHPDDVAAAYKSHEQALSGAIRGSVTFRKQRRDGRYILAEVTVRAIRETETGELREFVATTRDITDRHEAEESLRLIESAVKQVDEAVLITEAELDLPGPRIVYVNPAFTRMSGYAAEEVIGRTPRLFQGPRTSRAVLDRLRAQLTRGEPFEGETVNYRKDGSEYVLRWHIGPVRDKTGRVTHWVSIQRDVTKQKKDEQIARQRQAELAHVGRLSSMGEMASELAHELNQPLAAIANYVQGAKDRAAENALSPETLKDILNRIAGQADRAGQMIRRLRRFVRKREPQRRLVDVNRLVNEVVELVEAELRHHSIQLVFELDENLPPVAADAVQIEQVLFNLVRNAMEAMLQMPAETRHLRIETRLAGEHWVQLDVVDSGPGISAHQKTQLFEPFFTTKRRGMGMGLPISQSIAEAHGGRLEPHDNPTGGMDFRLILPRLPADQIEAFADESSR